MLADLINYSKLQGGIALKLLPYVFCLTSGKCPSLNDLQLAMQVLASLIDLVIGHMSIHGHMSHFWQVSLIALLAKRVNGV